MKTHRPTALRAHGASKTQPLPGHPYHGKTDAELRYIMKDAGEAARAMRDHNPQAEAKYLDRSGQ